MELLPWVFTSGWASGINAYLVVLILGGADRVFELAQVPDALQRTDVVADKVPYVDSTWDAVHTVIRPAVGAALGALIAGDASSFEQAVAAAAGGATALASHAVKAGLRAAVNTSPEPASNVAVSVGEDAAVASVISLAILAPWIAAGIAAILLFVGMTVVIVLMRRILAWRRDRRGRTTARESTGASA